MSKPLISGIQQIGIGVPNLHEAWKWYRAAFGMRVSVFDDKAEAALMTRYTNGIIESRHAVLAMNMSGGGGFEIWQYTTKTPQIPGFHVSLGDLGIFAARMKSRDVTGHHAQLMAKGLNPSPLSQAPDGKPTFWITDPQGNHFQVVPGSDWFKKKGNISGGVTGAVVGVSDMEQSIAFYGKAMGLHEVVYDKSGTFEDMHGYEQRRFRRVLLRKPHEDYGAFSRLLGGIEIELVQWLDGEGQKIFADRFWGDCGFIHLCFDTLDMATLKKRAENAGHPFTVDSGETFGMGDAGGRFAYVEDPDGTLIEMVETHKVPILKKLGLYFNLSNRKHQKPLPDWMVRLLGLNVIKD
jgi:catechol 2,3-dioxygenase-like lactoylglutathione lyase family enzyme